MGPNHRPLLFQQSSLFRLLVLLLRKVQGVVSFLEFVHVKVAGPDRVTIEDPSVHGIYRPQSRQLVGELGKHRDIVGATVAIDVDALETPALCLPLL